MNWYEFARTYEIIGSTVKPADDALPLRLTPIFRQRDAPSAWFLSVESDDSDDPPALIPEDAEWVEAQIQVTCDPPIEPRPGHWLMKIKANEPPEYVGKNVLAARLQTVYDEAIAQAKRSVLSGDIAAARRNLFFASRAHPSLPASEPMPQLALIPLLRPVLSGEDLQFFVDDVKASYQRSQLKGALLRMKNVHEPLWTRLRDDPALSLLGLGSNLGLSIAPAPSSRSFLDRLDRGNTMLPDISTLREFWKTPKLSPLQPALRIA